VGQNEVLGNGDEFVNGILASESARKAVSPLLKSHSPIDNLKEKFVKCRLRGGCGVVVVELA
jgi:hypothetical protein